LDVIDLVASGTRSASLKGLHSLRAAVTDRLGRSEWGRKALLAAARRAPLFLFKKLPTIIIIDVTNSCNLRCPVCPVTFAMHRPRGLMTLDIFKTIIDDFRREASKPAIYFNFSGEPTLNKDLPDMIEYADRHGHETFVSTNATLPPSAPPATRSSACLRPAVRDRPD